MHKMELKLRLNKKSGSCKDLHAYHKFPSKVPGNQVKKINLIKYTIHSVQEMEIVCFAQERHNNS